MQKNKTITVLSHSSKFHPDDIFAVATLLVYLKDKKVKIQRSRDMEVINKADYVVDVGGVYDPKLKRFDHHQIGGAGKRDNGVPYAAFGLVWKEYGQKICGSKYVADKIDRVLVQPTDSNDNGLQFVETRINGLHPFDIGNMVFLFSPSWKEDVDLDKLFVKLVGYAKKVIERLIIKTKHEEEGRKKVLSLYKKAKDKRVIVLDERYPWEETLMEFPEPLYVVYKKRVDENWTIKCVPKNFFNYENRKKLPLSWAGKSEEDLERVTGIKGSVFCHNVRFMAVAKTKEAVMQMAKQALDNKNNE